MVSVNSIALPVAGALPAHPQPDSPALANLRVNRPPSPDDPLLLDHKQVALDGLNHSGSVPDYPREHRRRAAARKAAHPGIAAPARWW